MMDCADCVFFSYCFESDITATNDSCDSFESTDFDGVDTVERIDGSHWNEMSYNRYSDTLWHYLEDEETYIPYFDDYDYDDDDDDDDVFEE